MNNSSDMADRFDLKGRLMQYFPILFELSVGEIDWPTVTKRFEIKMTEHEAKFKKSGQPVKVESSFFGTIVGSIKGVEQAKSFLLFHQKLFEELVANLDYNEKKLISNSIFGILVNIDLKYLNYLGELCVLNHIKRNTNNILIATEFPQDISNPKGSKIDFKFSDPVTGKELLLEVMNIHLNEKGPWSEEKIENLLSQKITSKLRNKGILKNKNFFLVPVLWGDHDDIKSFKDFYKDKDPEFLNTSLPVCFASYRYATGEVIHKFGSIDGILED